MTEESASKKALALLQQADLRKKREQIANELIDKYHFKTVAGSKKDDIYYYTKGIYDEGGEAIIKTEVEKIMGTSAIIHEVNEIISKIKRKTYIEWKTLDSTPANFIPFGNCIYDLKEKKTLDFSPDKFFLNKLSTKYDPEAECPQIIKFLQTVVYAEDMELIQEWIGYQLYRRYVFKKAVIIIGEKDTGKTTFLNLIIILLGEKNVSGETLQSVSRDKFAAANMQGKMANIADELPQQEIKDVGGFKKLTGNSIMWAEKKYADKKPFLSFAKLTYAANQMPKVQEISDEAFYDRWLIILFNNIIEEKDKDPFMFDKISTKEELSGFLNWAMIGLERLMKNTKFSYRYSAEDNMLMLSASADPIAAFSQDMLVEAQDAYLSKEDMYSRFKVYCHDKRRPICTKQQLGRNLGKHAAYIIVGQREVGGNQKTHCWINVKVGEKGETELGRDNQSTLVIPNKERVLLYLQKVKEPVSTYQVASVNGLGSNEAFELLKKLSSDGLVFEVSPDSWKIL
ncbi:hypothetical protein LCGC14_0485130 [marine sediment metagenome]|uniref:SF3 helicase domain-containing protein n=1 Tax=marine sediment metagenome TaxID=412755 RepID=A0A0F9S892_9ZZZZ